MTPPVTITANGNEVLYRRAEEAELFITISADTITSADCANQVGGAAKLVTNFFNNFKTELTKGDIVLGSYQAWNGAEGSGSINNINNSNPTDPKSKQPQQMQQYQQPTPAIPQRHHQATMTIKAIVSGANKLSYIPRIVTEIETQAPIAVVTAIDWRLSEATRKDLAATARAAAIRDARRNADSYAAQLHEGGRVHSVPVEITDCDALAALPFGAIRAAQDKAWLAAGPTGDGMLSVAPEIVPVGAHIVAKFALK
jgi:hypothetical protein